MLDYSRSNSQQYSAEMNSPAQTTETEIGQLEKINSENRLKRVREIVERSTLNDRRGQKSRNLYAVNGFDRRSGERRLNLDSSRT